MVPRLAPGCTFLDATHAHLESFAAEGLRTLVVATREIPDAEWADWWRRYEDAMNKLGNERKTLVWATQEAPALWAGNGEKGGATTLCSNQACGYTPGRSGREQLPQLWARPT